jgi:acid phosphatase (class B)
LLILFAVAGYAQNDFYYYTVSVDEIAESLPARTISVGLDVDDTVLFSSPGFYYGFNNADGPGNTNKYGKRPLSNDLFWQDLSGEFDKFSMPKYAARKIINMHKERGDKIYFITARPPVKKEILTSILKRTFSLPKDSPDVIFSGRISKGKFIRKHGISLYYGDSDSDISEANEVGVRAIRFMRSSFSTNTGRYHPGMYGEAVLENSEN